MKPVLVATFQSRSFIVLVREDGTLLVRVSCLLDALLAYRGGRKGTDAPFIKDLRTIDFVVLEECDWANVPAKHAPARKVVKNKFIAVQDIAKLKLEHIDCDDNALLDVSLQIAMTLPSAWQLLETPKQVEPAGIQEVKITNEIVILTAMREQRLREAEALASAIEKLEKQSELL